MCRVRAYIVKYKKDMLGKEMKFPWNKRRLQHKHCTTATNSATIPHRTSRKKGVDGAGVYLSICSRNAKRLAEDSYKLVVRKEQRKRLV